MSDILIVQAQNRLGESICTWEDGIQLFSRMGMVPVGLWYYS